MSTIKPLARRWTATPGTGVSDVRTYWRNYFDNRAAAGHAPHARAGYTSESHAAYMRSVVAQSVGQVNGLGVLDIGCGEGQVSRHLCANNSVIGLDFSPPILQLTSTAGLTPVAADMSILPFRDNSFDLVLCVEAMTCLPQPLEILPELVRVVVPGGRLVVTGLNSASLLRRIVRSSARAIGLEQPELVDVQEAVARLECLGMIASPVRWVTYYANRTFAPTSGLAVATSRRLATNFLINARKTD